MVVYALYRCGQIPLARLWLRKQVEIMEQRGEAGGLMFDKVAIPGGNERVR